MNRACLPNNQNKHENYPMRALPQRRDKLSGRLKTIFFRINKIILGPLLLLAVLLARGQEYSTDFNNYPSEYRAYTPILSPDSVVWDVAVWDLPGVSMIKIFFQHSPDSTFHPIYFYSDIYTSGRFEYAGKIKEDTLLGRLWWKNPDNDKELLIMDLNLNIDDNFEIEPGLWAKVDSIYILDGRKRVRFDHESSMWEEKITFIEGVGPNISPLYRLFGYNSSYMSCLHVNNKLIFQTSSSFFEGCTLNKTSLIPVEKNSVYNLFPNPTNSLLTVTLDPSIVSKNILRIFDITGKVVMQEILTDTYNVLDVSFLKPGNYKVLIKSDDFLFRNKLIIVK
jgi:hypothetical protein